MKDRVLFIDYAKFIGIFLVVLGHSSIPTPVVNFIYSFHMPLFFLMSGFLFDARKYKSFKYFASRRFVQLMLPYFFFSLITYLFWFFIGRKFGADAKLEISGTTPLLGILYGTDTGDFLIHCGSLWFLPCLFIVELLCFHAAKTPKTKFLMPFIFFIIGYTNYKVNHWMLPWSFDVALIGAAFYMTGSVMKNVILKIPDLKKLHLFVGSLLGLFLLLYLSEINGRADMSSNHYNNFLLFLIAAITGIFATFCISALIGKFFGEISILEYFAKNTLTILALHTITESVLKGILLIVVNIQLTVFKDTLFLNLLLSCAVFITLIPMIYFLNRYLPFFTGHKTSLIKN